MAPDLSGTNLRLQKHHRWKDVLLVQCPDTKVEFTPEHCFVRPPQYRHTPQDRTWQHAETHTQQQLCNVQIMAIGTLATPCQWTAISRSFMMSSERRVTKMARQKLDNIFKRTTTCHEKCFTTNYRCHYELLGSADQSHRVSAPTRAVQWLSLDSLGKQGVCRAESCHLNAADRFWTLTG